MIVKAFSLIFVLLPTVTLLGGTAYSQNRFCSNLWEEQSDTTNEFVQSVERLISEQRLDFSDIRALIESESPYNPLQGRQELKLIPYFLYFDQLLAAELDWNIVREHLKEIYDLLEKEAHQTKNNQDESEIIIVPRTKRTLLNTHPSVYPKRVDRISHTPFRDWNNQTQILIVSTFQNNRSRSNDQRRYIRIYNPITGELSNEYTFERSYWRFKDEQFTVGTPYSFVVRGEQILVFSTDYGLVFINHTQKKFTTYSAMIQEQKYRDSYYYNHHIIGFTPYQEGETHYGAIFDNQGQVWRYDLKQIAEKQFHLSTYEEQIEQTRLGGPLKGRSCHFTDSRYSQGGYGKGHPARNPKFFDGFYSQGDYWVPTSVGLINLSRAFREPAPDQDPKNPTKHKIDRNPNTSIRYASYITHWISQKVDGSTRHLVLTKNGRRIQTLDEDLNEISVIEPKRKKEEGASILIPKNSQIHSKSDTLFIHTQTKKQGKRPHLKKIDLRTGQVTSLLIPTSHTHSSEAPIFFKGPHDRTHILFIPNADPRSVKTPFALVYDLEHPTEPTLVKLPARIKSFHYGERIFESFHVHSPGSTDRIFPVLTYHESDTRDIVTVDLFFSGQVE